MGFRKTDGFVEFVVERLVRFFGWRGRGRRFIFRFGDEGFGVDDLRSSFDEIIHCRPDAWAGGLQRGR